MMKHPIDPGRVYLTGLCMGGFGCSACLSEAPKLFAAAAIIAEKKAKELGLAALSIRIFRSFDTLPFSQWLLTQQNSHCDPLDCKLAPSKRTAAFLKREQIATHVSPCPARIFKKPCVCGMADMCLKVSQFGSQKRALSNASQPSKRRKTDSLKPLSSELQKMVEDLPDEAWNKKSKATYRRCSSIHFGVSSRFADQQSKGSTSYPDLQAAVIRFVRAQAPDVTSICHSRLRLPDST